MRPHLRILGLLMLNCIVFAEDSRLPLSYRTSPDGLYELEKPAGSTSLLDYVRTRSDLSILAQVLSESAGMVDDTRFGERELSNSINLLAGFMQAFDTVPTWNFTFFAPSDTAFNNTGQYFNTYAETPKGKWWLGNLVQHHYVPNTQLRVSAFSTNFTRFQTGTFLYVGGQIIGGTLVLNRAARVTEADVPVTNGLVHIIDRIIDPAAMIFEAEIDKTKQNFIAGSCSNPDLPYC